MGDQLKNRIAIVTGGSQGIGKAISTSLANAGATVIIANIPSKRSDVEQLVSDLNGSGLQAFGHELDVTNVQDIHRAFQEIVSTHKKIDILINNAGIRASSSVLEATEDLWDAVQAVNLKGVFFASQAAAKYMIRQNHGRIINIASQLAVTAAPNRSIYIASKGGVIALTKSMALEWASNGITVNAIGPGPTNTPMTSTPDPTRSDADFLKRSPIGRRLEPEEIAEAAVFLASDDAKAINGHHLLVDAGWSIG